MRHSSRRRTRGFSLLEMMVAIAILLYTISDHRLVLQAGLWPAPFGITLFADGLSAIMLTLTAILAAGIRSLGLEVVNQSFFDTLSVRTGSATEEVHRRARQRDMSGDHVGGGPQQVLVPPVRQSLRRRPEGLESIRDAFLGRHAHQRFDDPVG